MLGMNEQIEANWFVFHVPTNIMIDYRAVQLIPLFSFPFDLIDTIVMIHCEMASDRPHRSIALPYSTVDHSTNPTNKNLDEELPIGVGEGHYILIYYRK